jgi:hypothetical protein
LKRAEETGAFRGAKTIKFFDSHTILRRLDLFTNFARHEKLLG